MQSDDPAFLSPGTEVSAKFKGAFCEAKIKKLCKSVKCKVALKEAPFGTIVVEEHLVRGTLEVNQTVDVSHGKHLLKGVIQHIKDCSTYHVVFNDGDEKVLRRTQMCLKGARHFDSESNLDQMPLYNPEQFCAPPKPQAKTKKSKKSKRRREEDSEDDDGKKRKKRAAASAASVAIGEMDQGDTEESGDGDMSSSEEESSEAEAETEREERKKKEREDEKEEEFSRKAQQTQKSEAEQLEEKREKLRAGSVVCVYEDAQLRGKWYPAVVVAQKAYRDGNNKPKTLGRNEVPIRSFQNGKYFVASLANLVLLDDQPVSKKTLDAMSNPQRTAVDRANAFNSKGTLPNNWTAKEIYAETSIPKKKEPTRAEDAKTAKKEAEAAKKEENAKKKKTVEKKVESSSEISEGSDEEEYGEERDLFVAQLYKFQEERGTPINRAPILGGKDIDLYRFYRVVQDYGGCKRVTTNQLWRKVLIKLHLEGCPGATPVTVRKAYIRYLAHFNSFYKRLGWSLDELSITSTINSPRERRLIRPAELLNQRPVKRRKSSAAEAKEKVTKKSKTDGRDSKETSRDPESRNQRERSTLSCSPSTSTSSEKPKKLDKEEEEKKVDRKQKDEELKEKVQKKEKKEKTKEKEKEEKAKEKEAKVKLKREEEVKEVEEKRPEKATIAKEEVREEAATVKVKASPSKAELEVIARTERTERRDSEREKIAAVMDKDVPVEKKDHDMSDEDGDGKKKKERKKLSKSDKKDPTDPTKSKDPDEGYRPSNIVSRFYLGQKVRAYHHGRWYDARVVTVDQPSVKEMAEIMEMHDEEGIGLSSQAVARLRVVLSSTRCFVHYLGWNSRYDESITLNKIRLSEKDDQTSMDAIKREMGERIPKSRLDFLLRWSNSTDGVESLTREDDAAPTHLFSMGGYRPRRVSISQYEQLTAAAAEGLKRESSKSSIGIPLKVATPLRAKTPTAGTSKVEHSMISPPSVGVSPPLRSPTRGHEPAAAVSHHAQRVSSPPSAVQVKRPRTMSFAGKESIVAAGLPGPSSSLPTTIYIATSHEKMIVTPPQKILSPPPPPPPPLPPVPEEISRSFEFASMYDVERAKQPSPLLVFKTSVKDSAALTCNEPPPKEKKRPPRVSSAKEKTPMDDGGDVGVIVSAYCDFELVAKSPMCGKIAGRRGSEALMASDEHLRKNLDTVTHTCSHMEVKKEEPEMKVETEAAAISQAAAQEDSDAEPSGSGTPMRTDGEDNDKWSTSDNQSAGGRMMSPGRGRGNKRKRAPYNRHSIMVVDRKYVRAKATNKEDRKEDDSYGEEEEEEVTRDTFISMKNKTYRMMEQEHSLDNFDILGLAPLGDLTLMTEDAIEVLDKRLNELREIYHNSRAELLLMERRRRKRAEKRKERERAFREASAAEK
ncbi:hypothetical protein RB195_013668 [Necator americanus]|uniref:ARID domain-containing protein n=1 Tax=Necator americanus TaxID=51031 RepID=A0ABR1DWL3_NECAM